MKLGLQAKMGLSILTPAIVGLMLVAGVCYKMSEEVLREQIRTDMTALLECQSIGLNAVFQGLGDGMKTMSENQRIRDQIGAYERSPDEAYQGALFNRADEALKSFVENNEAVYFAGLIALDGKVLGYRQEKQTERSKYVGSDFSDRSYFKKGKEGKAAVAGFFNPATGDAATVLAVPVMLNGQIAAVLFGGVDNKTLGDSTTSKIKVGSKGKMYVYDAQGRVVLNPDQAALGRDESGNPTVRQVLETKQGRTRFVDAKGDEKGLYYRYMPKEGWYLCVEFDREETFQPISKLLANASMLTVVCALIVGVIIFFSARGIVRMVGGISGLAAAVAQGRLEIDNRERTLLDGAQRRGDEFSTLAAGMEQMVGSIRKLLGESEQKTQAAQQATEVAEKATAKAEQAALQAENAKREGMLTAAGQLEDVVGVISSASSELAAQIEQSDRSAVESSQRLSEAATAMNEMNATVQEVARNASSASAVSVETKNNAESGAHIVESALQSIGQVQKVSLALKDDMAQLNEHAKAISQIMSVISDIADQTNLLALNAAIEAARAGEAGRGFAVVADEVRKLAEKTMASTHDVGNAISAIQNSAAQSVTAMDNALAEVETATDFASQSGEALRQIVSNVEATADQVSAIATASEQQSAASEEINQSIVVVNDMSGQTAQAMSEASKAVNDLAGQAQRLSSLIDEMKRG